MMGDVKAVMRTKNTARPRRAMAGTLAAGMLGMALISGCSGVSADEAAVIDGRSIGESQLQDTVEELNSISAQPATPSTVLSQLALTPIVDGIMAGTSAELTDQQVVDVLEQNGLSNPSSLTIDVGRTILYSAALQDPAQLSNPDVAEALSQLQEVTGEDIAAVVQDVNPRYGSFDAETRTIVPRVPEWITPAG
ncbi:MAG: hypothetical protein WA962_00805 [Ornithinimicrobium sp.]